MHFVGVLDVQGLRARRPLRLWRVGLRLAGAVLLLREVAEVRELGGGREGRRERGSGPRTTCEQVDVSLVIFFSGDVVVFGFGIVRFAAVLTCTRVSRTDRRGCT